MKGDMLMKQNKILVTDVAGTPFDDVFRTLLERCQKLIIPVINEVFGTQYTMDDEVTLLSNEHYIVESDGKSIKRITDSCIKIRDRMYHIECESNPKTGMEIRMIEYDFHIALSNMERYEDRAVLRFPESAVLFLRHNINTPDKLQVKLLMADGSEADYKVPVVKVQKYTKEEIFDKNLLFFIPYYIMRFEKELQAENTETETIEKQLIEDYTVIYDKLKRLEENQLIDYNYLHDLISLTTRLIEVVSRGNPNIMREVSVMGGGKVLEMESEKIYNRGVSQGLEQGLSQGLSQGLEQGLSQGLAQGLSQGLSQGIAQGISDTIIEFLSEYGTVPENVKERIIAEDDIDILRQWNKLAARASSIEEFVEKM